MPKQPLQHDLLERRYNPGEPKWRLYRRWLIDLEADEKRLSEQLNAIHEVIRQVQELFEMEVYQKTDPRNPLNKGRKINA